MPVNYVGLNPLSRIRNDLKSMQERFVCYCPSLDSAGRDARFHAAIAVEIKIVEELLDYIDQGMEPIEFLKRSLQFCANERSSPEAINLRASYTLYLLGLDSD